MPADYFLLAGAGPQQPPYAELRGTLARRSAGPQQPPPLTIAAAASLAPVFDELGAIFQELTGAEVVFSYGASGSLAEQIRNGAPFDAFASADALHVDELIAEGLLVGGTRTVFALGKLVLVAAPGAGMGTGGTAIWDSPPPVSPPAAPPPGKAPAATSPFSPRMAAPPPLPPSPPPQAAAMAAWAAGMFPIHSLNPPAAEAR
jgi:hypothetical protein